MSHELRTPLNSIIGFTEILLQRLPGGLNNEQERQLTMVRDSGRQLLALIDDVLDIARINAGRISVAPAEFSLRNAVDRVVEMMYPMADAKDLSLTVVYAEGAPDAIVGDRGKVDQILLNLLANAVTYTDRGSILVTVRPDGAGRFAVDVADTGLGIAREDLERIFEQFYRAHHDLAATHPGTGLGLPVSRRLAEALGGSLSVVSEVAKGSTFTVVLPVDGAHPAPDREPVESGE
jgi:Signal transduction histidine kinase